MEKNLRVLCDWEIFASFWTGGQIPFNGDNSGW